MKYQILFKPVDKTDSILYIKNMYDLSNLVASKEKNNGQEEWYERYKNDCCCNFEDTIAFLFDTHNHRIFHAAYRCTICT